MLFGKCERFSYEYLVPFYGVLPNECFRLTSNLSQGSTEITEQKRDDEKKAKYMA